MWMILRAFRVGRPAVKQFAGRLLSFPPGGIACSRLRAPCSTVLTGLGLFGVSKRAGPPARERGSGWSISGRSDRL